MVRAREMRIYASFAVLLAMAESAFAQETHQVDEMTLNAEDGESIHKKPGYSPYGGRNYPTKVLWGDAHLHTYDAKRFGIEMPEDAPMIVHAMTRRKSI